MNRTLAFTAASLVVASSAAISGEGLLASYEEAYRYELAESAASAMDISSDLKASVQLQFRYNYNKRGSDSTTLANPDDDVTLGFSTRRAKVSLEGKVTDDISGKIKFSFKQSSGSAVLQDAYLKWKLNDNLTLRAGQFKPALLREESMSSSKQLATDRTVVNEVFNQDFTQGIQLIYQQDDWRLLASFGDGFNSDNTFTNSSKEADYAFTARYERRFADAGWSQYKQFSSWRGNERGLLFGAAIDYQEMGHTNPSTSPETSVLTGTVDAIYHADGWNLYAAAVWRDTDNGSSSLTDAGYIVQGGVFVSDQNEIFARWDQVSPDNDNPIVAGTSGNEDFNTITVGWNHYIIPESHAAKFTVEAQFYPDPSTESLAGISGNNLLPDSSDDQFAITAQLQLLF